MKVVDNPRYILTFPQSISTNMKADTKQKSPGKPASFSVSKQYLNGYRFIVLYLIFVVCTLSLGSVIIYPLLPGTLILGALALFSVGLLIHAIRDLKKQGRE